MRNRTETQEGSTNNCRGHTCSKRHVSARVIFSLCLNICLSTHRLNTSAPQTVTALSALQAPRKCSAHNCAPCASDTSRVSRSPSVNNNFHEQGMDSRPLRDKRTTAALAREGAFKYTDNVARVTNQVKEPTEKKPGENLPALPCKTSGAVGAKRKTTPLLRSSTDRRTCLSPHKHAPQNGCETTHRRERIRQFMFAAALRTKHKSLSHTLG